MDSVAYAFLSRAQVLRSAGRSPEGSTELSMSLSRRSQLLLSANVGGVSYASGSSMESRKYLCSTGDDLDASGTQSAAASMKTAPVATKDHFRTPWGQMFVHRQI